MSDKEALNLTAGDLVRTLRGYGSSTPVKIVGAGDMAFVSCEGDAVVITLLGSTIDVHFTPQPWHAADEPASE